MVQRGQAFTFQSLDTNLMLSKTETVTLEWVITLHIGLDPETGQQAVYVFQESFEDRESFRTHLQQYLHEQANVYVSGDNVSIVSLEGPMYIYDCIIQPNETFSLVSDNRIVFSMSAVKSALEKHLAMVDSKESV